MLFLQNLKDVLADLIPKEQTRIKNFKQQYGKTNIGQITVDMVSNSSDVGQNRQDHLPVLRDQTKIRTTNQFKNQASFLRSIISI